MQLLPLRMLQLSLFDYLSFCYIYLRYHVEAAACIVDILDYSYSNSLASSEYHIVDHCYCSILQYNLSNSRQMILLPDYFLKHLISLVLHLAPHPILRVIHQTAWNHLRYLDLYLCRKGLTTLSKSISSAFSLEVGPFFCFGGLCMLMGALKRVLYNKNYLWYTFFNLFLTLFHHFTLNLLECSSACFVLLLFIMLLILLSLLSLIFQTLNFFMNLFRISLTLKFIIFRTILSANSLLLITNTKW